MGSSSKNRGLPAAPAKPTGKMSKGSRGGYNEYYEDPSQVPIGGGYVRPTAIPGAAQGIGLNYVQPAGSSARDQLALMQMRGMQNSASDSRLGYGVEGAYGGSDGTGTHASGGNWGGIGTAAGNAGRSIGRSLGIGDGKGFW